MAAVCYGRASNCSLTPPSRIRGNYAKMLIGPVNVSDKRVIHFPVTTNQPIEEVDTDCTH